MRASLALLACVLALACCAAPSAAQAPNPPPIWPSQFLAPFGLYMLDTPSNSPIWNATSLYSYNSDVNAQLISYPERCIPILGVILPHPGDDLNPCDILFVNDNIYVSQPALGVECCTLFSGVGPTPRNFTRGFTWNGTATAPDYWGNIHTTDIYLAPGGGFKYWTEVGTHHDIFFRDSLNNGVFWAFQRLNVTAVDKSTFVLPSDPKTCAQSCAFVTGQEEKELQAHAAKHGPIALALHHQRLRDAERAAEAQAQALKKQHTRVGEQHASGRRHGHGGAGAGHAAPNKKHGRGKTHN